MKHDNEGGFPMNGNFNESNTDFILINPNEQNRDDHKNSRPPRQKRPKEHTFRKRTIATVLSCVLIGGASGFGGAMIAERTGAATLLEGNGGDRTVSVKNVNTGEKMTAAQVYAKNVDATVGISTKSTTRNMFGYSTESAASGSGFIVSSNGYIVTNYHVIEGADSITVSTNNGKSYEATVRGYNESCDVAVLKINATGLQAVTLGKSSNANVGDEVVTIGNPLGELTFSLTSGSVDSIDVRLQIPVVHDTARCAEQLSLIIAEGSGGPTRSVYLHCLLRRIEASFVVVIQNRNCRLAFVSDHHSPDYISLLLRHS